MIDTVAITLRGKQFEIRDSSGFQRTIRSKDGIYKAFYNPDLKKEGYRPKLDYSEMFGRKDLRVEFSAGKLLFGNNFDEPENKDFESIVQKIYSFLTEFGVAVYTADIRQADVSAIHYSKNIILTDHTSSKMILSELVKIDLTKWLEVETRDYQHDGHALYYSAPSKKFMIVFYDKIKELEKAKITEKSRVEKDESIQMSLLDNFAKMRPFEVLRMEIRFGERRKLRQVLKRLDISTDQTFEKLFDRSISKVILQDYWQVIDDGAKYLSIDTRDESRLQERILLLNPNIKPMMALAICSTMKQISESGIRNFRNRMKPVMNDRYWYDWKKIVGERVDGLQGKNFLSINQIGKQLAEFEPVKLKNYPDFKFDNVNNS